MNLVDHGATPSNIDPAFVDRRAQMQAGGTPLLERRQFGNSLDGLTDEARELGVAIDRYKLLNRRRFITYEEMLAVIKSIGYRKSPSEA